MVTPDLDALLADATAVRVTSVGEMDARRRSATKPLLLTFESTALAQLRDALLIDEASLNEQYAIMTSGVLDIHWFRNHVLRATVTYLTPEFVRWPGWRFDARLREPQRVHQWLIERGWSGRGAEFTQSGPG